jgi:hypothetical protein
MQEEKSMKGIENSREQFVAKLKERLDAWNAMGREVGRVGGGQAHRATRRVSVAPRCRALQPQAAGGRERCRMGTTSRPAPTTPGNAWRRRSNEARVHFEKSPRK